MDRALWVGRQPFRLFITLYVYGWNHIIMLRVFKDELQSTDQFVITLELAPGSKSAGRNVDTVKQIAADAFAGGRVSAVSITDNPGGNPSLSPDALGHEIFSVGMDVIVHFTCRDSNRVDLESRALQLADDLYKGDDAPTPDVK